MPLDQLPQRGVGPRCTTLLDLPHQIRTDPLGLRHSRGPGRHELLQINVASAEDVHARTHAYAQRAACQFLDAPPNATTLKRGPPRTLHTSRISPSAVYATTHATRPLPRSLAGAWRWPQQWKRPGQ